MSKEDFPESLCQAGGKSMGLRSFLTQKSAFETFGKATISLFRGKKNVLKSGSACLIDTHEGMQMVRRLQFERQRKNFFHCSPWLKHREMSSVSQAENQAPVSSYRGRSFRREELGCGRSEQCPVVPPPLVYLVKPPMTSATR